MTRIRSGYSFKAAFGHLKDVASRMVEIGWERQPISDTLSTFAFAKWSKIVPNPMYGVELDVGDGDRRDRWTFFAIDRMVDLHRLIGVATSFPGAMLPVDEAVGAKGVIKIVGNRSDLTKLKPKTANLYVALSPSMSIGYYRDAKKKKFKFVQSSDNVYTRIEDKEAYRMALWRNAESQTYPQHILSDEEWENAMQFVADKGDIQSAIQNRARVFQLCKATLEKASIFEPQKVQTLRQMCEAGAQKKAVDLTQRDYKARLDKELALIAEKKFEDYFYIIADIVSWSKERMIVGPARGSSCGSLVCYLLDITAVDPIPYGLIFERFIDINRADLPDIDIDFSDAKRAEVFEYVENKYGREHVARLGTTGMFRPRSALNAAGMAIEIPRWRIEKVTDSLIERSSGDSRALQQLEDTLADTEAGRALVEEYPAIRLAGKLEGHPTNAGQHAAGMVITKEPIEEFVAIDHRTFTTMCDKNDAELLNLLKIDMLGLTQLSIFERTLELAGRHFKGFLEQIPLDDKKAFDILNQKRFAGIFQFNGMALQSLTKQIVVDKLDDIIAITALARPGPMASGGASEWVKRRMGLSPITFPHRAFEPHMKDTLGIVLYQEQILVLGREIGDLSWSDVTALRKAMSKSLGEEFFNQYGDRWKAGGIKKGIAKDVLDKVWSDLCAYGSWSFNKSHAVAYGLVSYYCCWFKAHYPIEFAAATLDSEAQVPRQLEILRELAQFGINYKPVDIEASELKWNIKRTDEQSLLVGPLTNIHGIGPKTALKIVTARAAAKPISKGLQAKIEKATTSIDSIYPVRDWIANFNLEQLNLSVEPIHLNQISCEMDEREFITIALAVRIAPRDENDAQKVAARGYRVPTPSMALNMFVKDDTDEMFCKIGRKLYEKLARPILEKGKAGKSILCIKGRCPKDFRMIQVTNIRYLGDLDNAVLDGEETAA